MSQEIQTQREVWLRACKAEEEAGNELARVTASAQSTLNRATARKEEERGRLEALVANAQARIAESLNFPPPPAPDDGMLAWPDPNAPPPLVVGDHIFVNNEERVVTSIDEDGSFISAPFGMADAGTGP